MRTVSISEVSKDVKVVDGILFIGSHKVESSTYKAGAELIPALYMVMVYDNRDYPVVVTGLDLMKDGKIWLGGYPTGLYRNRERVSIPDAHYDRFETIEHILNNICGDTIGKRWAIFEEEDFDEAFKDWPDYDYTEDERLTDDV